MWWRSALSEVLKPASDAKENSFQVPTILEMRSWKRLCWQMCICEEVQALTENSHKTKYLHSELAWFWFFLFIFLFFYCPFRACLKPFSPQTGSGFYTDGLFNVRASKRGKCRIFKHCLVKSSRPGYLCCLLKNKSYLYTILTTLLYIPGDVNDIDTSWKIYLVLRITAMLVWNHTCEHIYVGKKGIKSSRK